MSGQRIESTRRLLAPQTTRGSRRVQRLFTRGQRERAAASRAPVQRQGPAMPAAEPAAEAAQAYKVVLNGETKYMTEAEYKAEVKRVTKNIRGKVKIWRDHLRWQKKAHQRWEKETHNWAGVISDIVGGVVPPLPGIWDRPDIWLKSVEAALGAGNLTNAVKSFASFEKSYKEVESEWHTYLEKSIGGAESAVTALEITRDVSFAVAGALGAVVLVPTGASLIVAGGISAGVGAGFKGVEEVATRLSEMNSGLRKEFDIGGMFKSMGMAAVTGFAGALTGGFLSKKFYPLVFKGLSSSVMKELTEELGEEVIEKIFITGGDKLMREFISGVGSTALNETIKAAMSELESGKNVTPEKFTKTVAYEFSTGTAAGQFKDFMIKYATSAGLKK